LYQPPKPSQLQPAQQLLADIHKYQVEQKAKIERMFQTQKQFLQAPNNQGFNLLTTDQKQLKEQLESEIKALVQCYDQVVLEPPDLQVIKF
jgi:hypothetical protein